MVHLEIYDHVFGYNISAIDEKYNYDSNFGYFIDSLVYICRDYSTSVLPYRLPQRLGVAVQDPYI